MPACLFPHIYASDYLKTFTLSSFLISLRRYSRNSSSFCGSGAWERCVCMPYFTESSFSRLSEKLSSWNVILCDKSVWMTWPNARLSLRASRARPRAMPSMRSAAWKLSTQRCTGWRMPNPEPVPGFTFPRYAIGMQLTHLQVHMRYLPTLDNCRVLRRTPTHTMGMQCRNCLTGYLLGFKS